jgi:hypothetical protein
MGEGFDASLGCVLAAAVGAGIRPEEIVFLKVGHECKVPLIKVDVDPVGDVLARHGWRLDPKGIMVSPSVPVLVQLQLCCSLANLKLMSRVSQLNYRSVFRLAPSCTR